MSRRLRVFAWFAVLALLLAQAVVSAESLVVAEGETVRIGVGTLTYESVSIAGTVILGGSTTIVVNAPGNPYAFVLEANGIIKCDTTDGLPGGDGYQYPPVAAPGKDGILGAAGVSGGQGQNGHSLAIKVTGTATIRGIIDLAGTNGGYGGVGGQGGAGHSGASDTDGTRGGDGGPGGNGGAGGIGGSLDLRVDGDLFMVGAGIKVNGGIGANGGGGGQGGSGGAGGDGHCTCGGTAGSGGNGGRAGEAGFAGRAGTGGAGGTISIRVTGDISAVRDAVAGDVKLDASGGAATGQSTAGYGGKGGDAGAPGGVCGGCGIEDSKKSYAGGVGDPGVGTDAGSAGMPAVPGSGGHISIFANGRIAAPGLMILRADGGSAGGRCDQSAPGGAGKCPFDGCKAVPAMNGLPGTNGAHGGDGGTIEVRSKVGIDNVLSTSAVGGSGGPGGKGGMAGLGLPHGGNSTFTYGLAGSGGNGGTGGKGGNILFEAPLVAVTGEAKVAGAWGGERGAGGLKNPYDTAGSDGTPGQRGAVGENGTATTNLTMPGGSALDGTPVDGGPTTPVDNCPDDPDKTEPGACGCGVADTDSDSDGTPDCLETEDPDGGTTTRAPGALCGAPGAAFLPMVGVGLMALRHSRRRRTR